MPNPKIVKKSVAINVLLSGLRELYAHGVNLGALDFQGILEEMRLDGLEELQDEQLIRNLIERRQNYLGEAKVCQVFLHFQLLKCNKRYKSKT
jgi:hypothetical protein